MSFDKNFRHSNEISKKSFLDINLANTPQNPLSAVPRIDTEILHKLPPNWEVMTIDCVPAALAALEPNAEPASPVYEMPSFDYSPKEILESVHVLGIDRAAALELIEKHKLTPCHAIKVGNTQFTFSDIFLLDSKRMAAVALVENPQGDSLRVYYKSNSSGTFRLLPAINSFSQFYPVYDKLFGEENLTLSSPVQSALSSLCKAPICADVSDQEIAALVPFNRCYKDWDHFRDVTLFNPHKHAASESILQYKAREAWNIRIAPGFEPDYRTLIRTFEISDYFSQSVSAYVYHSANGQLEYVVAKEQQTDRIWFAMIGSAETSLDNSGLPARKFNPEKLLVPLYEYEAILPKGTYALPGPEGHVNYCCAWGFIRDIPYIRQWYQVQAMKLPN